MIDYQILNYKKSNEMLNKIEKNDNSKLTKATQEFEEYVISHLLKEAYDHKDADPIFGGGQAEEIYNTFLMDEYGKILSKSNQLGIQRDIMKQILILQNAK